MIIKNVYADFFKDHHFNGNSRKSMETFVNNQTSQKPINLLYHRHLNSIDDKVNFMVLGHFPSATSPAQFPQSQLPQQQFPHAVKSYLAEKRILVLTKELLVSQQQPEKDFCSFLRLSLPEPTATALLFFNGRSSTLCNWLVYIIYYGCWKVI